MRPTVKVLTLGTLISLASACGENSQPSNTMQPADTTQPANTTQSANNTQSSNNTQPATTTQSANTMENTAVEQEQTRPTAAMVRLNPTENSDVSGEITFTPSDTGVGVKAEITGLGQGAHGFHVHEHGDCSAPDASSAGDHFNPSGEPHGARTDEERHVGDLGNISANNQGVAHAEFLDEKISLDGRNSILGRAVIVHQGEDDLSSQPDGNAGSPVACGVIEAIVTDGPAVGDNRSESTGV